MASNTFASPFAWQVEFFRKKLDLPSERWDDIKKSAHDRGFIVAGANKADLVADLRRAIDKCVAGGKSLGWYQKNFDDIVKKHGWTGWTGEGTKAGRDWRTAITYQTNMSTSYAAGRWKQLHDPDLVKLRPYLTYHHADGVRRPRPHHLSWNGFTAPRDDPFWQTHACPNGWRCHCYLSAASERDYADAKTAGRDKPPEGWDKIDPKTGEMVGIDKGFGYAPGANANRPMKDFIDQKLINLDAPIGAAMWQVLKPVVAAEMRAGWESWLSEVFGDPVKRGRMQFVGAIDTLVLRWLEARNIAPSTAEITAGDAAVVGKKAVRHQLKGDALTPEEWANVPDNISGADCVLLDVKTGNLIYVAATADERQAKITIELNCPLKKLKSETNMIVSAFKLPLEDIRGAIKGGLLEVIRGGL